MNSSKPIILTTAERNEPLLQALLDCYRRSRRAKTGRGSRDFSIPFDKLVHDVAHLSVEDQKTGEIVLQRLRAAGVVRWTTKPFDRQRIKSVFVIASQEHRFFELLGSVPPAVNRQQTIDGLKRHLSSLDGHPSAMAWREFLTAAIDEAAEGRRVDGLPDDTALHEVILRAAAVVVRNSEAISLRRLSADKLDDSKLLGRRRETIERALAQFLPPDLANFEAWQVEDTPPAVRIFGPVSAELADGTCVGELSRGSPYMLAEQTLERAQRLFTSARRCISIENSTTFHEATQANLPHLLIHTSYPSKSVLRLLRLMPNAVELLHWGDTDPWGYDILRVLRERTGKPIKALHMSYRPGAGPSITKRETSLLERLLQEELLTDVRPSLKSMKAAGNKGRFEQESLPKELIRAL